MPKERGKTVLHYEKLDVYQVSIQFVAVAVALSGQIPKGYAPLADQLRRAAWSIPLNIAEGVGKPSPSDQARFHAICAGVRHGVRRDVGCRPGAAGELAPRVDEREAADGSHGRDVDQVVPIGRKTVGRMRTTTLTTTLTTSTTSELMVCNPKLPPPAMHLKRSLSPGAYALKSRSFPGFFRATAVPRAPTHA
jgi:hypothetical protein